MSSKHDLEKQPLAPTGNTTDGRYASSDCFLRHITSIARVFGLIVLAVMWAATVTSLQGKTKAPTYVGYYLLAISILITFFELTWIIDKMACCVRQGCCCRCWSIILWVDGWRKFILYTLASILLFLQGLDGIIDVITGFCLLVLACLYLIQSFVTIRRNRHEHQPIPSSSIPSPLTTPPLIRHEMATQTDVMASDDVTSSGAWEDGGTKSRRSASERERAEKERAEREWAERDRAERKRLERERAERAEREREGRERAAREDREAGDKSAEKTEGGSNPFDTEDSEEEEVTGDDGTDTEQIKNETSHEQSEKNQKHES